MGAEPTNFNCKSVDFGVDYIKPAVDCLKPLIDFLKSLLDVPLEANEVEMDLTNKRNEKPDLSFHLAYPPFEP